MKGFSLEVHCTYCSSSILHSPLIFLTSMVRSLRERSSERIRDSKFFCARTRFSEFLMWWKIWRLMSLSIPLDFIFLSIIDKACSKFPSFTQTLIPRMHCIWCASASNGNNVDCRTKVSEDVKVLKKWYIAMSWADAFFDGKKYNLFRKKFEAVKA